MKYDILYSDPPWRFKVWSRDTGLGRSADSHYPTMTLDDIKNLPIQDISGDDSILFLWVPCPMLQEGLEVIEKWGYHFKTVGFTWIKENKKSDSLFFGMGYYTRANTELCLLATRGKPKRIDASVPQVLISKIREHSQKPDEVRDKIVQLMGNLPRIELFATHGFEGWTSIGFEVDGKDIRERLKEVIEK